MNSKEKILHDVKVFSEMMIMKFRPNINWKDEKTLNMKKKN
jgi:hypothetical protein